MADDLRPTGQPESANPNLNQWLLDLADSLKDSEWKPGAPVDSEQARAQRLRDLYRDTFNREPPSDLRG